MPDKDQPITLDHFAQSVALAVSRAIEGQRGSISDKIFRWGGRLEIFIETQQPGQHQVEQLGASTKSR
jgi:hypothetical protein